MLDSLTFLSKMSFLLTMQNVFVVIFSIWYIFILSSFCKYLLSAFHLSSIVQIKGTKPHMVLTALNYGGFQFHSR